MKACDRRSTTIIARHGLLMLACVMVTLQGCGLLYDAVQAVAPVAKDELDAVCRAGKIRVGMAVEPFRPFVFPAIWTDEGARVTGLDVELVKELASALSRHCGHPVAPVIELVRFRDLFLFLNEAKLDLFVSAVPADIPSPTLAGFAYSIPYFYNGGVAGIVRDAAVHERVRTNLRDQATTPESLLGNERALAGLTVAVQESTNAHFYAAANLKASRLVLCDSLPAAFESVAESGIDVILGAEPVLDFMVKRVRRDWHLITLNGGTPYFLTRVHYSVVMAEESYRLRWFVNNLLFRLDEAGRLTMMRHRWLDEDYAYPRRAAAEGLPFDVEKMVPHYTQGTCRLESGP